MNLWKVFEQRYEHFLSVRVAKMALGCVWVRDDFFLDGSFNLVKDVVSGNFSGIDGFRLIFKLFLVFNFFNFGNHVNFRRFSSRGLSNCEFEYVSCKGGLG